MSKAEKFREWHKSRMGHDIGVMLGIEAVNELSEENAKLREMLKAAVDDVDSYGEFTVYNHKKAKDLLKQLKDQNNDK